MKTKLRLVKDPIEELRIKEAKIQEASSLLNYLIVQALCFKKNKEYAEIINLYLKFKEDGDVDPYLRGLLKFKYLYELGTPSERDISRLRAAFLYIKADSEIPTHSKEEKDCRKLLNRLMIRSIVLEKPDAFSALCEIGDVFRANRNILYFKSVIVPYLHLLELKDLPLSQN